jgi:hypothetical protein
VSQADPGQKGKTGCWDLNGTEWRTIVVTADWQKKFLEGQSVSPFSAIRLSVLWKSMATSCLIPPMLVFRQPRAGRGNGEGKWQSVTASRILAAIMPEFPALL